MRALLFRVWMSVGFAGWMLLAGVLLVSYHGLWIVPGSFLLGLFSGRVLDR